MEKKPTQVYTMLKEALDKALMNINDAEAIMIAIRKSEGGRFGEIVQAGAKAAAIWMVIYELRKEIEEKKNKIEKEGKEI